MVVVPRMARAWPCFAARQYHQYAVLLVLTPSPQAYMCARLNAVGFPRAAAADTSAPSAWSRGTPWPAYSTPMLFCAGHAVAVERPAMGRTRWEAARRYHASAGAVGAAHAVAVVVQHAEMKLRWGVVLARGQTKPARGLGVVEGYAVAVVVTLAQCRSACWRSSDRLHGKDSRTRRCLGLVSRVRGAARRCVRSLCGVSGPRWPAAPGGHRGR